MLLDLRFTRPSLGLALLCFGCNAFVDDPADGGDDSGDPVVGADGGDGVDGDDGDTGEVLPPGTFRLVINEFMAANSGVAVDPDDAEATPDWIELHNPSDHDVELTGFFITDDLADPRKHRLGALSLPAGGFLVLLADGEGDAGPNHLDFKLGAEGEDLGLFDPDGVPLDQLSYGNLDGGQVAGRWPDAGALHLLAPATPGLSNAAAAALDP